jgi:hypothetical protein
MRCIYFRPNRGPIFWVRFVGQKTHALACASLTQVNNAGWQKVWCCGNSAFFDRAQLSGPESNGCMAAAL